MVKKLNDEQVFVEQKSAHIKSSSPEHDAMHMNAKTLSSEDAEKKSRKGFIVGIVSLVILIAIATAAYSFLAPKTAPESLQVQNTTKTDNNSSKQSVSESNATSENAKSDQSDKTDAPDFEMTTPEGGKVTLSSLKGKPIVLNFWASTCGPCKTEMPEFQKAYEQYGDQLQFVMVNVPDFNGETRERALQLIEQNDYTFPVYFDDTAKGQMLYGITSIPQTYFINADGAVEAYASGSINSSIIEQGIDMLLS